MNELFTKKFDSDEEDEEYVPDVKELKDLEEVKEEKPKSNKTKVQEMWEKMKNKNNVSQKSVSILSEKTEHKEVVKSIDYIKPIFPKKDLREEIDKAINKAKELKNKTVKETLLFAGQKYEFDKQITEEDEKKLKQKEKNKTHAGLDSLVESLEKKSNVNTYTKTKKDWDKFVENKNLEKELDFNRKDGFLKRKQFIEETNARLYDNMKSTKKAKK